MDGAQVCEIHRPTRSASQVTAAGGFANSWSGTPTATVAIELQKMTPGRAVQVWGIESKASFVGWVDFGVSVQREDVLKVTVGPHATTYLLVHGVFPREEGDRLELELEETKERPDG